MPAVAEHYDIAPGGREAEQPYAALDLGSNSFHLIVAYDHGDRLQVVDRHKEMVRLAEGLKVDSTLSASVAARAIACLERLGQRIRDLPPGNVRVVGTNTLRKARNSQDFIEAAERALGHRVEIISGREEARLIYLGVSHSLEPIEDSAESRLVVDIGGGSTELILGRQFQPHLMESLYMGCVSMSEAFFGDGKLLEHRFRDAENAARQELEVLEEIYRARGWDTVIGASGSILAIHDAILELTGERGITPDGLATLKGHLLEKGDINDVGLEAIDAERAPVFAGGLAITAAVVDALHIDSMTVSDGALREGLLHDLLGRVHAQDIRETTVADLMQRYHVDVRHARRVAGTVARILEQVSWDLAENLAGKRVPNGLGASSRNGSLDGTSGSLSGAAAARLLRWAALLHEIGMDIAHSQYHKHGGYLLDNMDLPGFSRPEQHNLSMIVRSHRRKFPVEELDGSPGLIALCVLLRLAVVLHRGRTENTLPAFWVAPTGAGEIRITFPRKWLAEHPLTKLDLEQESDYLSVIPLKLSVAAL
ncbi:MAG: Ppx/GppA phosphatase family protein [Gammaproteobacteria bacterium]|nr:Ppx/GppA phosphatase family protein [Gammaproteobacteria bacterium]